MLLTGQSCDREYPIHVQAGCIGQLNRLLPQLTEHHRLIIVTDREVTGLHLARFQQQITALGLKTLAVTTDGSEAGKNLDSVKQVYEQLLDMELTSRDCLLALGGGSVIDLTAFVAATFLGGVDYVQVPTSLLAMVDSSISLTSRLNFRSSKNLIGVPNNPLAVFVDPDFLQTLPPKHLANGYAQIIQSGYLQDEQLISSLESGTWDRPEIIFKAIAAKIAVMKRDPRLLQFGQPVGDAIEGHFRFLKYMHGEALALGMLAASPNDRLRQLLVRFHLPVTIEGVAPETLIKRMARNCALHGDTIDLVRVSQPCQPVIETLQVSTLDPVLSGLIHAISPSGQGN